MGPPQILPPLPFLPTGNAGWLNLSPVARILPLPPHSHKNKRETTLARPNHAPTSVNRRPPPEFGSPPFRLVWGWPLLFKPRCRETPPPKPFSCRRQISATTRPKGAIVRRGVFGLLGPQTTGGPVVGPGHGPPAPLFSVPAVSRPPRSSDPPGRNPPAYPPHPAFGLARKHFNVRHPAEPPGRPPWWRRKG